MRPSATPVSCALLLLACAAACDTEGDETANGISAFRAACEAVAEDLSSCIAQTVTWKAAPETPAPHCMREPVPTAHRDALSAAVQAAIGRLDPDHLRDLTSAIDAATTSLNWHQSIPGVLPQLADAVAESCIDLDS